MTTTFCSEFQRVTENISDRHFNLTVADPPYYSGPEKRRHYGLEKSQTGVKRRDYVTGDTWEVPSNDDIREFMRVAEHSIVWGANYYEFFGTPHPPPRRRDLARWLADHPTGWIVWDKVNGKSSFFDYELAWTSFDRPTQVFPFMWNGMQQGVNFRNGHIMQGNKRLNERRIHPTQKPVALYQWLFYNYIGLPGRFSVLPKHRVFDPYLGSGSSRIAAHQMGIDFVGCEKDRARFDLQEARFVCYLSLLQPTLFEHGTTTI